MLGIYDAEMVEPDKPNEPERLLESYKLIAEDLGRTREQRARSIGSHITINSVILAACALLIREASFEIGVSLAMLLGLLLTAGVIVSLQWMALIREYEILERVRVGALEQIEKREEMMTIPTVFTETAKELNQSSHRRVAKFFYDRAHLLPWFFLLTYLCAIGSVVVIAAQGN